jgi:lipopolysaccharide export LptBFGC system permease protein LptF
VVLTLFALAIVTRRFGRLGAGLAGCLGLIGCGLCFWFGMTLTKIELVSPQLGVWLPHMAVVGAALVIIRTVPAQGHHVIH